MCVCVYMCVFCVLAYVRACVRVCVRVYLCDSLGKHFYCPISYVACRLRITIIRVESKGQLGPGNGVSPNIFSLVYISVI